MGCCHSSGHKKNKIKPKPENADTFSDDISHHSIYGQSPIVSSRPYEVISHDILEIYRLSNRISSGNTLSSNSVNSHHYVHRPNSYTKKSDNIHKEPSPPLYIARILIQQNNNV